MVLNLEIVTSRPLVKSVYRKDFSYFSTKTYVVGSQWNRVNEMVLLRTQSICSNWWIRQYLRFYAQKSCLSKPMNKINTQELPHNWLACFGALRPSRHVGTFSCLPGMKQYKAEDIFSCSSTQHSAPVSLKWATLQFQVYNSTTELLQNWITWYKISVTNSNLLLE